jgi:hypothetical protein
MRASHGCGAGSQSTLICSPSTAYRRSHIALSSIDFTSTLQHASVLVCISHHPCTQALPQTTSLVQTVGFQTSIVTVFPCSLRLNTTLLPQNLSYGTKSPPHEPRNPSDKVHNGLISACILGSHRKIQRWRSPRRSRCRNRRLLLQRRHFNIEHGGTICEEMHL